MYATPAVAGQNVYIGSCAGLFYAFDRLTGKINWSYDTKQDGASAQFHGDPLFTGKLVIVGSDGTQKGYVYAFTKDTGKIIWKTPVPGGFDTDLFRFKDSVIGSTVGGQLMSLEINTGEVNWKFTVQTAAYRRSSNTPALTGDTIYFAGPDGAVYAIEAESGQMIWKQPLKSRITTPVRSIGAYLWVGVRDRKIFRLNREKGTVNKVIETEDFPHHSLVRVKNTLVVLLGEAAAAALDLKTSKIRWQRKIEGEWSTYNPLIIKDIVLVGNGKGELFGLRLKDGGVAWSHMVGGMLRGLGRSNSILYIGTLRGFVHALSYTN